MGTPVSTTPQPARRLTVDEATRPIEGAFCAKCGRAEATIYPYEDRGLLICRSCSPLWLIRYMRDWAEKRWPVAA